MAAGLVVASSRGGVKARFRQWAGSLTPRQRKAGQAGLLALAVGAVGGVGYLVFRAVTPSRRYWPVLPNRGVLNGFRAYRAPTEKMAARQHAGVDLVGQRGDKIVAIADGEVIGMVTGYEIGAGLQAVAIRHPDADYIYAEIKVRDLLPGQKVKAGDVLGHVELNNEGRSMLHLEAWETGTVPKIFTPWYQGQPMPRGLLDVTKMIADLPQA